MPMRRHVLKKKKKVRDHLRNPPTCRGYFKSSVIVYCFNWGVECGHELREEGKTLVREEINHRIINAGTTIKTVEHKQSLESAFSYKDSTCGRKTLIAIA